MSSAKITLFSFYEHMLQMGDDLFSRLELPEGVNRDTAISTILLNGGEYEVIYADPYFMQSTMGAWSDKWYNTIERWVRARAIEYDPLQNYDRTESETRTPNITRLRTANLKDKRTADLENKRTADLLDTNAGTVTEEEQRSAYDSSSYEPDAKKITTPANTIATTGTDTMKQTGTDTTDHTGTDTNTETGTEKWDRRVYGNIGVTTSQQMLEAEYKVAEWSLYDSIARLFLQEYVIPVMV